MATLGVFVFVLGILFAALADRHPQYVRIIEIAAGILISSGVVLVGISLQTTLHFNF